MINRNFLILVALCICSLSTLGQNKSEIKAINLVTVFQLAGADNLSIQEYILKQKVAEADLHTAQNGGCLMYMQVLMCINYGEVL